MEVGEYVRTKHGIAKVIDIEENPNKEKTIYVLDKNIINVGQAEYGTFYIITHPFAETMINKFDTHFGDEKQILKHSKNIIDLIELYDYVNNFLVFDIITYENNDKKIQLSTGVLIGNNKIENVVTHEQFESIKYEVN